MPADARQVAATSLDALARRDVETAVACWAPDGVDAFSTMNIETGFHGMPRLGRIA